MAAEQVKTFEDIYTAVMEGARLQLTDTTSLGRVKRAINSYYQNEVVPRANWDWLRESMDLSLEAKSTSGTASVTQNSVTVTLSSAPATSKAGYLFTISGFSEVYRVAAHTAASTTVTLAVPYNGSTNATATYTLWTDRLPLPVDLSETLHLRHDFLGRPLDGIGYEKFMRFFAADPKATDKPRVYTTTDFVDPDPYQTISGLPALLTSTSAGLVKTLIFASALTNYLEAGDRIEVTGSAHYSFNGRFVVSSISTTTLTNDTLKLTGLVPYVQAATADASLTVKLLSVKTAEERYRELMVWPALVDTRLTLHLDYLKQARPMEDDADEPLMPVEDRQVLVDGGLIFAWASLVRNPEESAASAARAETKLARMEGRVTDSIDLPRLVIDNSYVQSKRRRRIIPSDFTRYD